MASGLFFSKSRRRAPLGSSFENSAAATAFSGSLHRACAEGISACIVIRPRPISASSHPYDGLYHTCTRLVWTHRM